MLTRWLVLLIIPYLCISCNENQVSNQHRDSLMLFAAASTTDAVEEIVKNYQFETGMKVRTNFAASSTLATQIRSGAEVDVFLSANEDWVTFLEGNNLIYEEKNILTNQLVLIVPKDSEIKLTSLEEITSKPIHRVSIADPESVPAGIYAKQVLINLDLWNYFASNIVRGADVRQALMFVEQGEAEAGIVYSTDAAITDQIRVEHTFDAGLSRPIRYPLVLLKHGRNSSRAKAFYQYMASQKAKRIFEQYGFTWLPES